MASIVGGGEFLWEVVSRGLDAWKSYRAPFNSDAFVGTYTLELQKSVELLPDLLKGRLSPPERPKAVQALLSAIALVVRGFHRKKDVDISCNIMVPRTPTLQLAQKARFTREGRSLDSFHGFLELYEWGKDSPGNVKEFVLPVERTDGHATDALLFGAPWAYTNGRPYEVRNTLRIKSHIKNHENTKVRMAVIDYFQENRDRIRSFVSLPVERPAGLEGGDGRVAVVNINSTRTAILGFFGGNQRKVQLVLTPFFVILAYYLLSGDEPSSGGGSK